MREKEVNILSPDIVPWLFRVQHTKFIRRDGGIIISFQNITHAEAAENVYGTTEGFDDGGYIEATCSGIDPRIILRDWADTIGINQRNIGYQREETVFVFETELQGVLFHGAPIHIQG